MGPPACPRLRSPPTRDRHGRRMGQRPKRGTRSHHSRARRLCSDPRKLVGHAGARGRRRSARNRRLRTHGPGPAVTLAILRLLRRDRPRPHLSVHYAPRHSRSTVRPRPRRPMYVDLRPRSSSSKPSAAPRIADGLPTRRPRSRRDSGAGRSHLPVPRGPTTSSLPCFWSTFDWRP